MFDSEGYQERFGGIRRVYGEAQAELLSRSHFCVVGVGGVGSWAVEALARTGVGTITLIDPDDIALSNTNRQLHTMSSTVGQHKVDALAERIALIHPQCTVHSVREALVFDNMPTHLHTDIDYVIDAIDSVKTKTDLIYYCKRNKIPLVTTGGAGGMSDPGAITVADLSKTYNDPLAAKIRSRLRSEYSFTRNPKRRFGIDCVFSSEQPKYPKADGSVCHSKPGVAGMSLDCEFGYGSSMVVTASFGLMAVSRAINKHIATPE